MPEKAKVNTQHPAYKKMYPQWQKSEIVKGQRFVHDAGKLFLPELKDQSAAEQTGRTAYLMEIDPLYVDVTVQRWEQFTGEKATLEER